MTDIELRVKALELAIEMDVGYSMHGGEHIDLAQMLYEWLTGAGPLADEDIRAALDRASGKRQHSHG